MAIVIGNEYSPAVGSGPIVNGPMFGVAQTAGATGDILWRNTGQIASAVLEGSLDLITAGDAAVANALVGRRVQVSTPTGQNNWGIGTCVAVYKRTHLAGAAVNYALIRNPDGYFVEVAATLCAAVQ